MAAASACSSFGESAVSSAGAGAGADAGADAPSPDGAVAGSTFCAARSGFDVCSDFDVPLSNPANGWDAFNGPNGEGPKADSSDAHSAPSSLRFDFTGTGHSNLGLAKTVGSGTVFHVEAAVRFDAKVQSSFVDIARLEIETPSGSFVTAIDMQPAGMHFGFCPEDRSNCVYGDPPYDLQTWKTIAFDIDTTQSKVKLTIGGTVEEDRPFPAARIDEMTVYVGPRESADGNTLVVRYDDILVSHR